MNNNEKKVKYFLRKTAYGLASMSAAFIVCSGIVNTPTVSADSPDTLKVEKLGKLKDVKSVHELTPISIPNELKGAKEQALSSIISHPNITNSEVDKLASDYSFRINTSNDVNDVKRLLNEFYNAVARKQLDTNSADYRSKIDNISTTGLAIALEAKEIYEANKSILPHRYKDSVGTYVNSFEERRSPGKFNIWNGQEGFNAAQKLLEDVKKLLLELQNLTKNNKPNIQVPKQAPTEAAKPALSPEALTRLTTWYNQAKDLLKDDQVKDKYVDILSVQKAVDQAYDHVEEGKFITTDQANQLANKLRDALQSLELKDKKVAKPVAKGTYDVKYVDTEGKEVAKSRHFEGEEGAAFVTSAKEVAGYKLVRTEGAVSNVFTAGAQVRTYVYEKVAKPVAKGTYDVKYVDTEGKEVDKSRHFEGEEGAAFVTSAKEVAGYKLVRTEGAVSNVFTAGAQVRTYVYEKVKPEVKPDVKPEAKPEAKPEVKPDVKPEAKPEAKPEVKSDVKPEAKPEAKPATKKSVNTSGNLVAKKAIENKKYSKKLPSTGEAASPLLAIVSLIVMLSAGLITIVLKHKKN
ncbi:MucBP domain-containing protein [Streptococcus agalactiae]|uniref:MucBP domain-containing protein n=1 Tax=Streptococcus agalactiae TaxID=1311 RepID=UPI001CE10996|nr:MucBP domain-containing protein [Streptococcus agalactiae]MCA5896832.1 MucBP domain-containing protein [Streptococcus agalactiae]MCA5898741.1 MucBP domain-containing protein [Streptococcus agalactiae]MCA5915191.1 MucBP domain-containing protein [Streptococcus agalactiae]MCA5917567.1 MucBP domain-containing protein [Streptococcus agalactiae]